MYVHLCFRGSESSDSHSVYSDSPDIKISSVTDQIEEEQQERDVRNYETIDHRVLKQTEEKKIRYLDQPINQFHLGGKHEYIAVILCMLYPSNVHVDM